jgi:hypothetical protein
MVLKPDDESGFVGGNLKIATKLAKFNARIETE